MFFSIELPVVIPVPNLLPEFSKILPFVSLAFIGKKKLQSQSCLTVFGNNYSRTVNIAFQSRFDRNARSSIEHIHNRQGIHINRIGIEPSTHLLSRINCHISVKILLSEDLIRHPFQSFNVAVRRFQIGNHISSRIIFRTVYLVSTRSIALR